MEGTQRPLHIGTRRLSDNQHDVRLNKGEFMLITRQPLTIRNPFSVAHLPITGKCYKRAAGNPNKLNWAIFNICRRIQAFNHGRAAVVLGSQTREFVFNASNTQFESLYMDVFRLGYEIETCLLISKLLTGDSTFFDIGSNWGHLSVYAATIDGYSGSIHAFEPTPRSFDDLRKTVQQLGLNDRIFCHNVACSDKSGFGRMVFVDRVQHSGLARLDRMSGISPVRIITLDESGLPSPQVIKLDVEGEEHRVLLGAQRIISTARPFIVFETWAGAGSAAATKLLRERDYKLYMPCLVVRHDDGVNFEVFAYLDVPSSRDVYLTLFPWEPEYRSLFRQHFNAFACPVERTEWVTQLFQNV